MGALNVKEPCDDEISGLLQHDCLNSPLLILVLGPQPATLLL